MISAMNTSTAAGQRKALGEFLRRQRAKLQPAAVGLPTGLRRRTPGLRREELAALSGMSATWYSWVEQGRPVSLSVGALARLAMALRLSRAERAYLFELAGRRDPSEASEDEEPRLPQGLERIVTALPMPAYVLDRSWRAVAWNPPAKKLFVGWLDQPQRKSLLEYIFLEPAAKRLISDWENRARRILAEFRVDFARHMDDADLRAQVAELTQRSAAFARIWDEHAVLGREGGERGFNHPDPAFRRFEQTGFTLASHPDLKLMVLTPISASPTKGAASEGKARPSARNRAR